MKDEEEQKKISFDGVVRSVQPRANVWRYTQEYRTHRLTGYNVFFTGMAEGEEKEFSVAISEKQYQKLRCHIGERISGTAWTKKYPKQEYADYYRAGTLKKLTEVLPPDEKPREPWTDELPDLSVYEWRGCRMLDSRCWSGKCFTCKWACMSNVTIEYRWGVSQKFRFETFCYGPFLCKHYKMGRRRAIPNADFTGLYDEGWLDEICTQNRQNGWTEPEDEDGSGVKSK